MAKNQLNYLSSQRIYPGPVPDSVETDRILSPFYRGDIGAWVDKRSSGEQWTVEQPLYSTVVSGMVLSINAGNNTFDISAGKYLIVDSYSDRNVTRQNIDYSGSTGNSFPTILATNALAYVFIDAAQNISFQINPPNESELDTKICLGALITADNANFLEGEPFIINSDPVAKTLILLGGTINRDRLIPKPVAGTTTFNLDAGKLLAVGRNWHNNKRNPHTIDIAGQSPIDYILIDRNGNIISPSNTTWNFGRWDDNGTIVNFGGNDAAVQRVYLAPDGKVLVQLGQERYNSIVLAIQRWTAEVFEEAPILGGCILIALIIGRAGTTDVSNSNFVRVIATSRFGESTSGFGSGEAAIENWREVGTTGEPVFANNWQNLGGSNQNLRFRLEGNRVALQGVISSGNNGQSIFTLPTIYRPPGNIYFVASTPSGTAEILVQSDGEVICNTSDNSRVSIDRSIWVD
jgi:hypothetical protein